MNASRPIFDPLHYLGCWNRRPGPWNRRRRWPAGSCRIASCICGGCWKLRLKKHGSREYIQVLRLLETFALEEVSGAIEDALRMGTISFDAVRHILLCRIERRPPRLDLENYPHLPLPRVRTTAAADYMTLLAGISTSPAPRTWRWRDERQA